MKNKISYIILSMVCMGTAMQATAQKLSIKPHVNIGVGNAISVKSDMEGLTNNSSAMDYGVDFGYTFWKMGGNRLEVNMGVGYQSASLKLGVPYLGYSYNAPATADEDGNPYVRYYEISNMEQKVNLGYFNIPIYLTYGYKFSNRFGVHADLGFKLGFKCGSTLKSVRGTASCYGVFPEYDNLVIKDSYIDGFGTSDLSKAKKADPEANGFNASLLVGAGLDVYIAGPLWFNVGVRYDCGFTNSFKNEFKGKGGFTADNAPVTYTVANGQEVKPLTGYLKSSKLSPFSIYLGFDIKF